MRANVCEIYIEAISDAVKPLSYYSMKMDCPGQVEVLVRSPKAHEKTRCGTRLRSAVPFLVPLAQNIVGTKKSLKRQAQPDLL